MTAVVETVLPWTKGKVYSREELHEAAIEFYGPRARLIPPFWFVDDVAGRLLGVIEAGHDRYLVVEHDVAAAVAAIRFPSAQAPDVEALENEREVSLSERRRWVWAVNTARTMRAVPRRRVA